MKTFCTVALRFRNLSILLLGPLLYTASLWGAEPSVVEDELPLPASEETVNKWETIASQRSRDEKIYSYIRLAKQAWLAEDAEQAERYLQFAQALSPRHALPKFARAHLKLAQGDYPEAARTLAEAFTAYPDWMTLRLDVASFFLKPGDFVACEELLEKLMKAQSNESAYSFLLLYLYHESRREEDTWKLLNDREWKNPYAAHTLKLKSALEAKRTPIVMEPMTAAVDTEPSQKEPSQKRPAVVQFSGDHKLPVLSAYMLGDPLRRQHLDDVNFWYPTIQDISAEYSVDPNLVAAVIFVESRFNPRAVSSAGARGMMQLIPSTARRFGVADSYDPEDNIRGGVRYLRYLLDMLGSVPLAVAAYNAGERNVVEHRGIPPFVETQRYVARVLHAYERLNSRRVG